MSYQRLKTDINGGFPLVLDDIRWLQGELSGPMIDWLDDLCGTKGAVWLTGGKFPNAISIGIGGGVVYIKGEGFFNVPANNLAGWNGTTTFLRIDTSTFDSAGLKTFQNGTSNNTYELPQADIVTGTSATGDVLLNDWIYLHETFGSDIVTFESGISKTGNFKIIVTGNRLTISCVQINGPAGTRTTDEDLFTLNHTIFDPEGTLVTLAVEGGGAYNVPVTIDSNGKVTARFGTVNGEYPLAFELNTVIPI